MLYRQSSIQASSGKTKLIKKFNLLRKIDRIFTRCSCGFKLYNFALVISHSQKLEVGLCNKTCWKFFFPWKNYFWQADRASLFYTRHGSLLFHIRELNGPSSLNDFTFQSYHQQLQVSSYLLFFWVPLYFWVPNHSFCRVYPACY